MKLKSVDGVNKIEELKKMAVNVSDGKNDMKYNIINDTSKELNNKVDLSNLTKLSKEYKEKLYELFESDTINASNIHPIPDNKFVEIVSNKDSYGVTMLYSTCQKTKLEVLINSSNNEEYLSICRGSGQLVVKSSIFDENSSIVDDIVLNVSDYLFINRINGLVFIYTDVDVILLTNKKYEPNKILDSIIYLSLNLAIGVEHALAKNTESREYRNMLSFIRSMVSHDYTVFKEISYSELDDDDGYDYEE